jgi:hypothetical protein
MAAETRTTTDHEEIRRWVEEHGGKPATIRGTSFGKSPRLLTIDSTFFRLVRDSVDEHAGSRSGS